MPAIIWRNLVIDASVARSCGGPDATYPVSVYCRDFLITVQEERYHVVITSDIKKEWNKHQSRFALTWLTAMRRRGKVRFLETVANPSLREKIEQFAASYSNWDSDQQIAMLEIMLKDFLLIEAAVATDKTVISLDDHARRPFQHTAISVTELREVVWVNPGIVEEEAVKWLKDGAKPDKKRMLSFGL